MSQQLNTKKFGISDRFVLLTKQVGNQSDLAELLGISTDYVSMIVTGKRTPGPRLLKDFEVLERKLGQSVSEKPNSVEPGLADAPLPSDYATIEQCRERIKELEGRNAVLEAMVMAALKLRPISYRDNLSSKTGLSEDQAILKQADENEEAQQRAARRHK